MMPGFTLAKFHAIVLTIFTRITDLQYEGELEWQSTTPPRDGHSNDAFS
jgi:hypothetical protein